MPLNKERCMIRPSLVGLNPVELKCYTLGIRLDKCSGSSNAIHS